MKRITTIVAAIAVSCGAAQAGGDPQTGRLIAESWCASCHVVSDTQASGTTEAPPFASIARRSPDEIEALKGFLADPHPPMPDFSLTRDEIRDLLAYIGSLRG